MEKLTLPPLQVTDAVIGSRQPTQIAYKFSNLSVLDVSSGAVKVFAMRLDQCTFWVT